MNDAEEIFAESVKEVIACVTASTNADFETVTRICRETVSPVGMAIGGAILSGILAEYIALREGRPVDKIVQAVAMGTLNALDDWQAM